MGNFARSSEKDHPGSEAARNLVLIGYRGSGKSSVGRIVARQLGWEFVDTDELIEAAAGRSIRRIFEQEGEAGFRKLEEQVIGTLMNRNACVIAAGGGAVLSAANSKMMRSMGKCVWLRAPADELHRRIEADSQTPARRPALTQEGGLEEVRRLLCVREPLYRDMADIVVDALGKSPAELADQIVRALGGLSPVEARAETDAENRQEPA